MAEFPVNTHRFEPYKNFRFVVSWDGRPVLGVSTVSALKQTVDTVTHRQGGNPNFQHIGPGLVKCDPVTLERGVTWDFEFETWARKVFEVGQLGQPSLREFRKDVSIELRNESNTAVRRYFLSNCWVSEIEFLPQLDANSAGYAIERLVMQVETITRDEGLAEELEA